MGSRPPEDTIFATVVTATTPAEAPPTMLSPQEKALQAPPSGATTPPTAATHIGGAGSPVASQEQPPTGKKGKTVMPVGAATARRKAAASTPAPVGPIRRTLVVTHVECANHITPALSGRDYLAGCDDDNAERSDTAGREPAKTVFVPKILLNVSPEQPERVTAVFRALKECAWRAGGTRLVDAVELETSPTMASALDSGVREWALSPEDAAAAAEEAAAAAMMDGADGAPSPASAAAAQAAAATAATTTTTNRASLKRAFSRRTMSVSYLFDDVEPIVLRIHDLAYLSRIASEIEKMQDDEAAQSPASKKKKKLNLCRCVSLTMTGDTFASARSLHAALCASYACCRAVDGVVRGTYRNAFAVVRPPGHHAGPRGSTTKKKSGAADAAAEELVGQGFCLINHVAVAARYVLANHASVVKRVAVIDWDLHHGNGTEDIFCADDGPLARDALRDAVLFCSIHGATPVDAPPEEHPLFPGTARTSTRPVPPTDAPQPPLEPGRAFNVALPRNTTATDFLEKFKEVIAVAEAHRPDLVIISAGFDAHKDDLFRFFKLNDRTFKRMTELVVDLAQRCCDGRLVSVLEGGYHVPTLVRCATVHVKALATHGQPLPVTSPKKRDFHPPSDSTSSASSSSMPLLPPHGTREPRTRKQTSDAVFPDGD